MMSKELQAAKRRLKRIKSLPMTDRQAAKYVVRTHGIERHSEEKPEDFVLRIVQAYDNTKDMTASGMKILKDAPTKR